MSKEYLSRLKKVWSEVSKTETPIYIKIVLLFLVLYLLNPIDIIPDFIPVLGQLDDLIVTALILRWVSKKLDFDVRKYV